MEDGVAVTLPQGLDVPEIPIHPPAVEVGTHGHQLEATLGRKMLGRTGHEGLCGFPSLVGRRIGQDQVEGIARNRPKSVAQLCLAVTDSVQLEVLLRTPDGARHTAPLPQSFGLAQNHPNPFHSGTVLSYSLPSETRLALTVHSLAGQKVATLVEGVRAPGSHAVTWGGRDDDGQALATGVYLYRLQAGDRRLTRKLVLLR